MGNHMEQEERQKVTDKFYIKSPLIISKEFESLINIHINI